MSKNFEDLTGQRFHRLTVLRKVDNKNIIRALYECQCDCGNITYVPGNKLIDENTKSCGCLYRDRFKNLEGERFGNLVVTKRTDKRYYTFVIYECKCDCGNVVECNSQQLKKGAKTSCGCKEPKNVTRRAVDLTGRKFDKLTVIEATKERQDGYVIWKCQCDCGNITYMNSRQLQHNDNLNCGCTKNRVNR